jgi:hypothetical protein
VQEKCQFVSALMRGFPAFGSCTLQLLDARCNRQSPCILPLLRDSLGFAAGPLGGIAIA